MTLQALRILQPLWRSRDGAALVLAVGLVLAVKSGLVAAVPW